MKNAIGFVLLILTGVFPIFCSIKNYNWFFEHRKARVLVNLLGRRGARIFYALLGIAVIVFGLVGMHSDGIFATTKADTTIYDSF